MVAVGRRSRGISRSLNPTRKHFHACEGDLCCCRRFAGREYRMSAAQEELSFTYFPDNYRWSHGLLIGLNMAPWGGAEIGEVHRIGLRLKHRVGDDDAWFREWAREARTVEDRG